MTMSPSHFSTRELVARVKAVMRRSGQEEDVLLCFDNGLWN
jgi:DNA-binding response OmpR family regulator